MKEIRYNRIKVVLAEEGIDNAMLAAYLGVTVETVSKWRTNRGQPPLKKLYMIAEFLKMDVRNLLVPRNWEPGPSPAELAKEKMEKDKEGKDKKRASPAPKRKTKKR